MEEEDDEEALMQRALALSMQDVISSSATAPTAPAEQTTNDTGAVEQGMEMEGLDEVRDHASSSVS